jgi:hypothetical protein
MPPTIMALIRKSVVFLINDTDYEGAKRRTCDETQ